MNKKIVTLLVLSILMIGCKSKKAYSDNLRTKNVLSERRNKKTKPPVGGAKTAIPSLNDPEKFVAFRIASVSEYIDIFSEIAQLEMKAYGIPASITLAQIQPSHVLF